MTSLRQSRVFFDASCLFAAAASPTGGSGLILLDRRRAPVAIVTGTESLGEATRNLREKLMATALSRLEVFENSGVFEIWESDTEENQMGVREIPAWASIVNAKDTHVVRDALDSGCQHIISLDRGLIQEVTAAGIYIRIWTPGDFINNFLTLQTQGKLP